MENASQEFVKMIKERLKYPIATLYLIILIIYNWDVLGVFILSKTNIENRIIYINEHFQDPYYKRIWIPFVKAICYYAIAPFLMLGLDLAMKWANKERRGIKRSKEIEDLDHDKDKAAKEFLISEERNGKQNQLQITKRIEDMQKIVNETNTAKDQLRENYDSIIQEKDNQITEFVVQRDITNDQLASVRRSLALTKADLNLSKENTSLDKSKNEDLLSVIENLINSSQILSKADMIMLLFNLNLNDSISTNDLYPNVAPKMPYSTFTNDVLLPLINLRVIQHDVNDTLKLTDLGKTILKYIYK